jgi:hypothetical protein
LHIGIAGLDAFLVGVPVEPASTLRPVAAVVAPIISTAATRSMMPTLTKASLAETS